MSAPAAAAAGELRRLAIMNRDAKKNTIRGCRMVSSVAPLTQAFFGGAALAAK
jgi:hypothetical protein